MQRRCPNCNRIAEQWKDSYYCPYCGINFPKYEIAFPIYKEKFLKFDLTSRIITLVAGFILAIISYLCFIDLFSMADDNYPYTVSAVLILFWIASVVCLIFSFAPSIPYYFLKEFTSLDLTKFRHIIAFLIIIIVFLWIIGFQLFVQVIFIAESIFIKNKSVNTFLEETANKLTFSALFIELTLNFLILGIGIIAYVVFVYGDRYKPLEYLKIKFDLDNTMYALGIGLVLGVILFSISLFAFAILKQAGISQQNKIAEKMSDIVGQNLAYIFIVSAIASISEEIFFRGFLQKHIGIIPSSFLFGLVHIGYLTFAQVAGPFILGIVWGVLLKKTDNLAAPISSHFIFNFLSFLALMGS